MVKLVQHRPSIKNSTSNELVMMMVLSISVYQIYSTNKGGKNLHPPAITAEQFLQKQTIKTNN